MPAKSRGTAPLPEARFVFRGTVKQLQAATSPTIPDPEKAAIVRVDEVIQAPALFSKLAGRDITVYLDRKKIAAGDKAIFYAMGVHFGKSIAVRALDHHAVEQAPVTLAFHGNDPVKNLKARDTQAHMETADLVISGTVVTIRQPLEPTPTAEAAAAKPVRRRPSEHDPHWQEAVIRVDQVYKGSTDGDTVVVRFPSSADIMWREAPKFRVGQRGVFLLHQQSKPGVARTRQAATTAAASPAIYTALHPMAFHPSEQMDLIRPLLAALSARAKDQ